MTRLFRRLSASWTMARALIADRLVPMSGSRDA